MKKPLTLVYAVFLVSLVSNVLPTRGADPARPVQIESGAAYIRQSQEDNIREAVFRWQFDHNASGLQKHAKVYFIAVGEKNADPSDEFVKRFIGNKPPVRKRSECTADAGKGVLDKKTQEQGLIFRVTSIKWKSTTEVEVEGGYYEAGLSASGNIYTVKKVEGKWRVTNDKLVEIS